jgi:2-polyprenyl-3-methyl-5-hydroxy-6-metoxy-1,4-benzoquinol methylase
MNPVSSLNNTALRWQSRKPPRSLPDFQGLVSASPNALQGLRDLVQGVNRDGGTYHRLDFGAGLRIAGDYDLRRYVHLYNLPDDLTGRTVLDIGSATGYFALECARRGAKVTATDIYSDSLLARLLPFLSADVTYVQESIYDLAASEPPFDLVVCGSLLLHLPDPVEAIRRIQSVCGGQAIVATACPPYSWLTRRAVCEFRGRRASGGDYFHYWELGAVALTRMLTLAGFAEVRNVRHFLLESEPERTRFSTPHVVVSAFQGAAAGV